MPAETLHCPDCGASVPSDATRCAFCGATLATVTCPSCFGTMFAGAKFCSHCGAQGNRSEAADGETQLCPRCQATMKKVTVGTTSLLECARCAGIWVDVETLRQICADREKQAPAPGTPAPPEEPLHIETQIRYVPCPVCHQLMNRVNFAICSHIIVDVCKQHGTWFDKDELRRAVEFIRAGGLDKARGLQLEQIKEEQRKLNVKRLEAATFNPPTSRFTNDIRISSASGAIDLLFDLLK
jgi:Zn-finger nucleic acid-binding protein